MPDSQIIIELLGKTAEYIADMGKAEHATQQVGTAVEEAGIQAETMGGKMASGSSGLLGFGMALSGITSIGKGVLDFMKELASLAQEAEVHTAKLTTALQDNIPGWNGDKEAVNQYLDSAMHLAFTHNELTDSMAALVTVTHSTEQAERLQAEAADLARAKNIDLGTATTIVSKVFEGHVAVLGRYGIAVDKGATSTQALAALQKAVAGQGEAFANTTEGATQRLSNAWEEVKVGDAVLPMLATLATGLATMVEWVMNAATSVGTTLKSAFDGISPVLTFLSQNMDVVGTTIGVMLVPALAALAVAAWTSVIPAIVGAIVAAAPFIAAFVAIGVAVFVLKTAIENNFLGIGDLARNLVTAVTGAFQDIQSAFSGITSFVDTIAHLFDPAWQQAKASAAQGGWETGNAFVNNMMNALDKASGVISMLIPAFGVAYDQAKKQAQDNGTYVGAGFVASLQTGIQGAIDVVKKVTATVNTVLNSGQDAAANAGYDLGYRSPP